MRGKRIGTNGTFFQPTVLTGVTSEMTVAREETFGPLAPLFASKMRIRSCVMPMKRSTASRPIFMPPT